MGGGKGKMVRVGARERYGGGGEDGGGRGRWCGGDEGKMVGGGEDGGGRGR